MLISRSGAHASCRPLRGARTSIRCAQFAQTSTTAAKLDASPFKKGDVVLLRNLTHRLRTPHLTVLSESTDRTPVYGGKLQHADLLGARYRSVVETKRGVRYELTRPTLAEYAIYTSRIARPVYPADANLIVSLLDINATAPGSRPLRIFEAGSGHGCLTLHLARALSATAPTRAPTAGVITRLRDAFFPPPVERSLPKVISIDSNEAHSEDARRVLANYRGGAYTPLVDFYVASIQQYFKDYTPGKSKSFDHVVLDLPGSDQELKQVVPALETEGLLVVFNPSVTQILDCVKEIQASSLPLALKHVIELPTGSGAAAGGREWDLRLVRPKKFGKAELAEGGDNVGRSGESEVGGEDPPADDNGTGQSASGNEQPGEARSSITESVQDCLDDLAVVCRPKVHARIQGGGFVGVWRKIRSC